MADALTRQAPVAAVTRAGRKPGTHTHILAIAGIVFWILLWAAVVVAFKVSPDFLPTPLQVLRKLVSLAVEPIGAGTLWVHAGWSILRLISRFAVAAAVGI